MPAPLAKMGCSQKIKPQFFRGASKKLRFYFRADT
jgi:hypothetical protein